MVSAMMIRRWCGFGAIIAPLAAIGCHRTATPTNCQPYTQLGPAGSVASLPTVANAPKGEALLVGTVADSQTGQILNGARVLLIRVDAQHPDSTLVLTTAEGQFTVRGLRPGRYQYRILSVSFEQRRGTVELTPGIDTLQVEMRRGPPICSIRLD